jgi:hypothetical protein
MSQSAVAPSPVIPKKVYARVALVNPDESTAIVLRDCFRQFGIRVVLTDEDAVEWLRREKFEACVVRLSQPEAEPVLEAARNSPSNSRIVIYGIAATTQEAMRFSRYGINAILDDPVERQSALKVVRATHLLVLHELRRYVRLPMVADLEIVAIVNGEKEQFRATGQEISAGGMSIRTQKAFEKDCPLDITFTLPGAGTSITIRATLCWSRKAQGLIGVRFDPAEEARITIKRWVDGYLEIP